MTFAKICGLSTPETLDAALAHGAVFVGAVTFEKSPRHLDPLEAATLFDRARGRAKIVSVLVDPDDLLLTTLALTVRPDFVQLHGSETPARAEEIRRLTKAGIIKALPVRDPADLGAADAWTSVAGHLMFDAKPPPGADLPGGVGHAFDWSILSGRTFDRPWFLAGGLDPDNVTQAIRVTGAPLVDVSSGVESAPGVKEPARIAAFLRAVAEA
ncbi:MAG TPA: phosphoribosylanthranilate isomerase [Brevundimonas sp.]|jgi:phosphoribosylanthranilate isomerase|uniref:phosphoribosylanthranilate isomerase n=1 Tax=Brevundimonas sp. TaxID=1871086 RepID=UPI002DEB4B6D|nr:phosphoribosylanthranilate isomerase [Brevundimonas sp.]